jgi:hypothetical protein
MHLSCPISSRNSLRMSELSEISSVLNKIINWLAASRPFRSFLSHPSIRRLVAGFLPNWRKFKQRNIYTATRTASGTSAPSLPPSRKFFQLLKSQPLSLYVHRGIPAPNCIQLSNLLVKRQNYSNYYRFRTTQGANSPENDSLSSNASFGHSAVGRSDDRAAQAE